jgi:hypothetical protein
MQHLKRSNKENITLDVHLVEVSHFIRNMPTEHLTTHTGSQHADLQQKCLFYLTSMRL